MALWVTCENCRRKIKAREVQNNTVKCTECGHLQYVADPNPAASFATATSTSSVRTHTKPTDLETFLGSSYRSVETTGGEAVSAVNKAEQESGAEVLAAVPAATGSESFFYWLLLFTLIPLGLSLFQPKSDVRERFEKSMRDNPGIVRMWKESDDPTIDSLIRSLPGAKIEGAWLPRGTAAHWGFALIGCIGFLILTILIFPGKATNVLDLTLIGAFTGTIGVLLLFIVQFLAYNPFGILLLKAGAASPLFWILQFIGFSYRSALDPHTNIVLSFIGFTAGVGLCEELVKALPLLWYYRSCERMSWRGACRWGLATGVGFGIAEAIAYSADFYNGIHTQSMYIVRFASCVGLHAMWSASVGITLFKCQAMIQQANRWFDFAWPVLRILGVAMILHGFYDTLLKKDLYEMALAVAVVSFAWLAWQIENLREEERKAAAAGTLATG
jgi:RsiW-degrading membrane proteinase PrsW (M82 family)